MKAFLISDEEYQTKEYDTLKEQLVTCLSKQNFEIQEKVIKQGELQACMGCYGCWVKTPGKCVIQDGMEEINKTFCKSDIVIYLSPIVFGQYSPNIKKAIDRWLVNVLPLFVPKADKTTGHPQRYASKPKMIVIGYKKDLTKEEAVLFQKIVTHRKDVAPILFFHDVTDVSKELLNIDLKRIEV